MALKRYNVTVNNHPTVLQLDEAGAKARGLTDKDLVGARQAEADAPAPAPEADADAGKKAADAPANKSRTAANK